MTTNNHPEHGPVSLDRLHQIREVLSKAAAQSDGGNLGYAMADAVKVIDKAIAAFNAELYVPTVQCWSCREVIEVSAVGDCDGYCPKCDSPIDLDEEPYDAAILQAGNSPVIPDGWVIVPKKLTAENGAKGVLSGEFSETTFISCPECFGDDDCDTCDGSGRIEIKVPVTWTTIKSIWDKGIAHFAAKPPQEVNRG